MAKGKHRKGQFCDSNEIRKSEFLPTQKDRGANARVRLSDPLSRYKELLVCPAGKAQPSLSALCSEDLPSSLWHHDPNFVKVPNSFFPRDSWEASWWIHRHLPEYVWCLPLATGPVVFKLECAWESSGKLISNVVSAPQRFIMCERRNSQILTSN